MYSQASNYIERRRRWRAVLGIGKNISDRLEKHGIVKKDHISSWSNIVRGNPLFDKWLLLLLGGGVSLGGITAIIKKARKKVGDTVNSTKSIITGKNNVDNKQ